MTDFEKAEENYTKVYLNGDISLDTEEKYFAYTKGYCKGHTDGLAEGRKEKWHDLRENPDDLPERIKNCNHTHEVLRQDGVKVRYNYYREAWQYFICDNLLTKCEVIAWCEVPKFEGRK